MSKVEDVKRMVKQTYDHFRRIDILVNNAGQGYDAPIEKIDVDTFRYIFDLDFLGQLLLCSRLSQLCVSREAVLS